MSKLSTVKELWEFLRVNKRWWLLPIIVSLLLLSALIAVTASSSILPSIYALF